MKADIEVAVREHQWFKFMLHLEGGRYNKLEHTVFTTQKYIKRNAQGQRIDSKVHTRQIPLNFQVESHFCGEFLCDPNELFYGSEIEMCFSPLLYPPPKFEDNPPTFEDSQYYDSDDVDWDCSCEGVDIDGHNHCICLQGRDPYD